MRRRVGIAVAVLLASLLIVRVDARRETVNRQTVRDSPATAASNGRGLIAGTIIADDPSGHHPLRHALVTLSGTGIRGGTQVLSDDEGRFGFPALVAGRYTLTAERAGYVKTYYGSNLPARGPATPIAISDGQQVTDVRVNLLRGAVLTGTIYDENHRPMPTAQVHADYLLFVNGDRRAVPLPGGSMFVTTDERGVYRIYGLPPGDYRVFVGGGSGARMVSSAEIDAAVAQLNGAASEAVMLAAARAADGFPGALAKHRLFPRCRRRCQCGSDYVKRR